jgi:membrane protease YdiL (CAAX protease family)
LGKEFWQGVVWGLAMVTTMVLLQRAEHVFEFGTLALRGGQLLQMGLLWGTATLLVGFCEELTFRGYVQFTLASGLGFWPAAVVSSLAFGVTHMSDSFYDWRGVLSAALFGLLFCLILQRTGSLWMAVGLHSAVDFSETFVFSPPTRGLNTAGHLLNCRLHGSNWLTGGAVGPEASLNGLIVFAIVFVLFYRSRVHITHAAERTAGSQSGVESSRIKDRFR